jgi:hypothetical protein
MAQFAICTPEYIHSCSIAQSKKKALSLPGFELCGFDDASDMPAVVTAFLSDSREQVGMYAVNVSHAYEVIDLGR